MQLQSMKQPATIMRRVVAIPSLPCTAMVAGTWRRRETLEFRASLSSSTAARDAEANPESSSGRGSLFMQPRFR